MGTAETAVYTDAVSCILVVGFRFLFLFGKVFL